MNPFIWLRKKVAEAFVLGASDGLAALTPDDGEAPADLAALRERLAAALAPGDGAVAALPEARKAAAKGRG